LLVNMGLERVSVRRIAREVVKSDLVENWDYWSDAIQGEDRRLGVKARKVLHTIYDEHGTGYSAEVVSKLIQFELRYQRLPFVVSPTAKSYYQGEEVGDEALDCLVVGGRILLVCTALFDTNDFNISRGKSFMDALGLEWGIAANFGKQQAQFNGLRSRRDSP